MVPEKGRFRASLAVYHVHTWGKCDFGTKLLTKAIPVALTMIAVMLGFGCLSAYFWKEKGVAEAQVAALQQQQAERKATQDWLNKGYFDLKRDNPKAVQKYFPSPL